DQDREARGRERESRRAQYPPRRHRPSQGPRQGARSERGRRKARGNRDPEGDRQVDHRYRQARRREREGVDVRMTDFDSSTQSIPETAQVPRHVAIIMDGNGRWAKKRFLPRVGGHRKGVEAVREIVKACIREGVEYLTIFAFSSENWRRPKEEVT